MAVRKDTQRKLILSAGVAGVAAMLVSGSAAIAAQTPLYWNPFPLNGTWDTSSPNFATTSGGAPTTAWTDLATNDANFDQAGTYTVTVGGARTAGTVTISNGNVTFGGGATVTDNTLQIDNGATLVNNDTADLFKAGQTSLVVNGTFNNTAGVSNGGHLVNLTGSGAYVGGGLRAGASSNFSGSLTDGSASVRAGFNWNGLATAAVALSGDISGASGDFFLSSAAAGTLTLKLSGSAVMDANQKSYLNLSAAAGGSSVIQLAGSNLTRVYATGTATGGINLANTAGFSAVGADRTVTYVTALGGSTNASLTWGSTGFNAGALVLADSTATGKLTLVNDISLVNTARTMQVADGTAAVDAELSGVISGTGTTGSLTKTGTGTLLLSNTNSYSGGTTIANTSGTTNTLRISNSAALGTGSLTIGGGGNTDQSRLEVLGGITVANTINGFASRSTAAPNIVNISDNNKINSNLSSGGGGNQATFESDAGTLTLAGTYSGRTTNLTGDGNGVFSNNAFTIASGYVLNKSGTGTWTLQGTASYAGATNVTEGSLVAKKTTNLALGTGDVTVSSGANVTIQDHAGGGQLAYANNFTLAGSGTDGTGALKFFNSGLFNVSGTIAISGGTTIGTDPNSQTSASTPTFTNVISGSGGLTLLGQAGVTLGATGSTAGTPRFALTSASNYTGGTLLTSNSKSVAPFTVALSGGNDRLPTGTTVTFGGTPAGSPVGTFDRSVVLALGGISQQVEGLAIGLAAGTAQSYSVVGDSTTASTLVVDNAVSNSFSGLLGGAGANNNNLSLTKSDVGTLTLSGTNTYAGGTSITGGTLVVSSTGGTGTGDVTVAPATSLAGAVLELDTATALSALQSLFFTDNGAALASANLNYLGTDTIFGLSDNGVAVTPGIYGGTGSGADTIVSYLSGTGTLTVVPEPATLGLMGLGGLALLRRRNRAD